MIRSMTGYGKQVIERPDKLITIEIRSLNSKQADINIKTPQLYKEKDLEIRSLLLEKLERGKIDFSLYVENLNNRGHFSINQSLAVKYHTQIKQLAEKIGESNREDLLSILVKLPEVLQPEVEVLDPEEWKEIHNGLLGAIRQVVEYRISEGSRMGEDVSGRISKIINLLDDVTEFEHGRTENTRNKLKKELEKISAKIDENRFEQELVYYLEKFDITEEKVRLKKHCEYFLESMKSIESNGKKLNFISQEMGREINTLGAKANEANIQKIVVQMKDELEKIKEQLANIL